MILETNVLTVPPQIRAAEEMLSLTRSMKEEWLLEQSDTTGESKVEVEMEEYDKEVAESLRILMGGGESVRDSKQDKR